MNNKDNTWIQTYTGRKFYPLTPKAEDINITDIAWALSNLCRFNGHSKHFYSVAEHSIYVSENSPKQYALQGLLHDAAEAYIGDIASPIKPFFKVDLIEKQIMRCISIHFGLDDLCPLPDIVKQVDRALLADEAMQIMNPCTVPWPQLQEPPLNIDIKCYSPAQAFRLFMYHYENLQKQ